MALKAPDNLEAWDIDRLLKRHGERSNRRRPRLGTCFLDPTKVGSRFVIDDSLVVVVAPTVDNAMGAYPVAAVGGPCTPGFPRCPQGPKAGWLGPGT